MDQFRADTNSNKINLMIGVYKTDEGTAYVLPSVKRVGCRTPELDKHGTSASV